MKRTVQPLMKRQEPVKDKNIAEESSLKTEIEETEGSEKAKNDEKVVDEKVEKDEYRNRLLDSKLVMLNQSIALHAPMRVVNNLSNNKVRHVIYVHEVCAEEILN